ncbi:MAG: DUF3558 family protein [Dietzia sp.]
MVLSGCGAGQEDDQTTTTSPVVTETSGNPWDLPIEQRPALFDPCAEIPIEAVEQGVGGPVEEVREFSSSEPEDLISCGWKNGEVHFVLLATWKSHEEYRSDRSFAVIDEQASSNGRSGLRLTEAGDNSSRTCTQLFFTSQGTMWVSVDLVTALREFKGQRLANACDALEEAVRPIVAHIPEGDYR